MIGPPRTGILPRPPGPLARLIRQTGGELAASSDHFVDDDGSPHEENINAAAEGAVVAGTREDRYAPAAPVTRAQMATFPVRATNHRLEGQLPAGADAFTDDDGNPHEDNINAAAETGLTGGTNGATYAPAAAVRRDQMGSFLAHVLDLLVAQGRARLPQLPPTPSVAITTVVADPDGDRVQPEDGEYVALTNTTDDAEDLTGWYLEDEADHRLETCGLTVEPGATVRIDTGPGTDSADRCYNDRGAAVLYNDGDILRLFNRDQLVDTHTY